ncbi:hypothetical protein ERJ75_000973300 [Trypanosoma vivax]|uniref:Uncharacterized protein n=1 Tax=Trypanosoma vivax (strain Y486) TaxID=1055687 RepID=G0U688_TRYVY|nr:hypothetical protein TRVL_10101 [Trypanosoma vivax]KAH8612050.1 hypothetical protein ERJ75_000973300 [Trypanosoma vivax]CCC51391.1 conserved hypothetical protein [Trypanosoma vivax Y486]
MGCGKSKLKQCGGAADGKNDEGDFLKFAEENPVAAKLKEEWEDLVRDVGCAPAETQKEIWANTTSNPVQHSNADRAGRLFLHHIRKELIRHEWCGVFDYTVVGGHKEGYLKVNVLINTFKGHERAREMLWDMKVLYYASAAS